MPEHLNAVVAPQVAAAKTRIERRKMRRAGISLQVRIRTADFNDGNFDEVRMTQNASRKAIYFFTELNRYYNGMRVRVTSPYNSEASAVNLEQIGEVARVHRRADGYGVVMVLLAGAQATETPSGGSRSTPHVTNPRVVAMMHNAQPDQRCVRLSPF